MGLRSMINMWRGWPSRRERCRAKKACLSEPYDLCGSTCSRALHPCLSVRTSFEIVREMRAGGYRLLSRLAAMAAKHIIVYGRVQGVGFRYFVQAAAERLGLTGSVCNCPDSTVEISVAGNPRRIEEFIQQVKQGPSLARVDHLDIQDLPDPQDYESFSIEGW